MVLKVPLVILSLSLGTAEPLLDLPATMAAQQRDGCNNKCCRGNAVRLCSAIVGDSEGAAKIQLRRKRQRKARTGPSKTSTRQHLHDTEDLPTCKRIEALATTIDGTGRPHSILTIKPRGMVQLRCRTGRPTVAAPSAIIKHVHSATAHTLQAGNHLRAGEQYTFPSLAQFRNIIGDWGDLGATWGLYPLTGYLARR